MAKSIETILLMPNKSLHSLIVVYFLSFLYLYLFYTKCNEYALTDSSGNITIFSIILVTIHTNNEGKNKFRKTYGFIVVELNTFYFSCDSSIITELFTY